MDLTSPILAHEQKHETEYAVKTFTKKSVHQHGRQTQADKVRLAGICRVEFPDLA